MENSYLLYIVLGIGLLILIFYFGIRFQKNRKPKQLGLSDLNLDLNKIVEALGDKTNIIKITSSPSKLTFIVNDSNVIKVEELTKLGASGIVQSGNKITAIFGKISPVLAEELTKLVNI